jgi:PAS domain S-box-containing protein
MNNDNDFSYFYFRSYAEFLLKNHLDDLAKETIIKARESQLPVLKLFAHLSDEELFQRSKIGYKDDVLIPIIEGRFLKKVREGINSWKANAILIPKEELEIADITGIYNIRKSCFFEFLKFYNYSKEEGILLIQEIEKCFDISIDMGLKAYEEIQRKDLTEKNEILNGILNNIPVIITQIDKQGNILKSIGSGLKLLGLDNHQLTNTNLFNHYPQAENTRKAIQGARQTFTGKARAVSGETRYYQSYFIPEENGALGFSIDITKEKVAEERYRILVEGIKDYAIFFLDPEGTIRTWNEGGKRLEGYEEDEIIGKNISIFYLKEAVEQGFPKYELEQAKKLGRFEDEGISVRKDGSSFHSNIITTPIYNDEKELVGFSKITRDLTEKKAIEEALIKNEERHRLLIEAVTDYAIFMLDQNGIIESWNEGARRLMGYSENEIKGKHFSIFYPEEKRESNYPGYELEQAKKVGRFEDEGERVRKDGSRFYANVIITGMYDKNKKLIGFSKITRDLTEKRKAEDILRRMNAELEKRVEERTNELSKNVAELKKLNNDLDNFIYTASHDLKAPISNIEGLLSGLYDELDEQGRNNPNIMDIKEMINVSVKKFQETIKDLSEIAKAQKSMGGDIEEIDLLEMIEDIKISIFEFIHQNEGTVISDVQNCRKVFFVRKNLKSILYNLISNGIKYRAPDRKPVVTVSCAKEGDYVVLDVKDNGLGIKAEYQNTMFGMFKRFHTHIEGTGVGLYIVKKIIENAGGKIEVESEENKGSVFKVFLPVNPA